MKIINEPLHIKVEQALLKLIEEENNAKLKSEEELSKTLGVSRSTIREAMNSLLRKGILTKRHGKGNFIHRSAVETKMRIDLYQDFMDLIRDGGHEPSLTKLVSGKIQPASEKIQRDLKLEENELVNNLIWLYKADNIPAIYADISIPKAIFSTMAEDSELTEGHLRDYLSHYCSQDLAHGISKIKALQNPEISKIFDLDSNTSFIMWEELFYNIYDEVIAYNEIYFNPQVMDISLLIKI